MIEVEIKVEISNPDEMRKILEEKNGIYKFSLLHEDTYFNMPKGLRDFRESDEALRIRKSVEFDKNKQNSTQNVKYFLTYKGEKLKAETKTRKELESLVEDGENVKEILKALGFREIFTVKKNRELYLLEYENHQIEALIDYIPILNTSFLEVEYPVEFREEIENAEEILFNFLRTLGFKREESIRKSYLELIADKLKINPKK